MSMIGKEKLVFDLTAGLNLAENDNVGAFIRASDGTRITHTADGASIKRLDVSTWAEKAEDAGHNSGDKGNFVLAVRHDTLESLVSDDNDYAPLQVDSLGRLKVAADINVDSDFVYAEDVAANDGDLGAYVLSVRSDTLGSTTSDNGDFQSLKTDSVGALWTRISQAVASDAPNTAFNYEPLVVGVSAVALPAAPLSARKRLLIQNLGNKAIFIGDASVTDTTGVRIAAGGNWEVEIGPDLDLYAISTAASQDVRIFELA